MENAALLSYKRQFEEAPKLFEDHKTRTTTVSI